MNEGEKRVLDGEERVSGSGVSIPKQTYQQRVQAMNETQAMQEAEDAVEASSPISEAPPTDAPHIPSVEEAEAESEGEPEFVPNAFEQHDQRLMNAQVQPPSGSDSSADEDEDEEAEEGEELAFWQKITETDEELDPFGGHPPFTVRPLGDGDTWKVGNILGKAMGDNRITQAMNTGRWDVAGMALIGTVFDTVGDTARLWLANLIGIERNFQEVKIRMQAECLDKDGRQVATFPTPAEIERRRDQEILDEFGQYPPGTSQVILTQVMQRDDFPPFWRSCKLLAKTAGRVFSKLKMS